MLTPNKNVSQKNITAGRDNVGGNQYNSQLQTNIYNSNVISSRIVALMQQLADEVKNDIQKQNFIDTLQFYHERYSHDGVDGLEGKLAHAGRADEIDLALKKKELFTRLLAKYSMFDSAQQIFAYMLSKIEQDYLVYVLPNVESLTPAEIDQLIHERLVLPTVVEVGAGVFSINAALACGMVYWLAEQCYIRWHS